MSLIHSLSFRVLVGSIVLLLLLFAAYSFFTVRYYTEEMMQQVLMSANRMSDVIKQSTHYSMLLNRRDDVYQTITTIGSEPGVEGIRIYNKRGEIMFSTDKREERSTVDLHAEACYACHDQEKPLESLSMDNRMRIYSSSSGQRILGVINPIRNEQSCATAQCHAHPPDRTVLGILDVRMSLEQVDAKLAHTENSMIAFAVGMIILIAIISVWFLSSTILTPIKTLTRGAQAISSGNLEHQLSIRSKDELGQLAQAFTTMTHSLQNEKEQNRRWSETLQERVREKTDELNTIHKQILHIEKMTSLGKLAATVAHELNNPLEAILTYAKLIARRFRKDPTTVESHKQTLEEIDLIARETARCGTIVKSLLLFSKKQVNEFALVPVKEIVEKARELISHHCKIANVQLQTIFHDTSVTLMCDESQIQQALVALFINAVEAMPDGGTITVEVNSSHNDDEIIINITDTGVGIAQHDLPHLFEPFFTTKKDGKGVGLGLSVVYGIIERHAGSISVESEVGKGTRFIITLPRVPKSQQRLPKQTSTRIV